MTAPRVTAAWIFAGLIMSLWAAVGLAAPPQIQAAGGDSDLTRITETLSKADGEIRYERSEAALELIAEAINIVNSKRATSALPGMYEEARIRANDLLVSLHFMVLRELNLDTSELEEIAEDMTRIKAGNLKRAQELVRELSGGGNIGGAPHDYAAGVRAPLAKVIGLIDRHPIARLTAQEREDLLDRQEEARRSADSACASTDLDVIKQHIRDIRDQLRVMEQRDREAAAWRELRARDEDAGGLSETALSGLRRHIDRLEDDLPRLKQAAGWVSDFRPTVADDRDWLRRTREHAETLRLRFVAYQRILRRSLALADPASFVHFGGPKAMGERLDEQLDRASAAVEKIAEVRATLARVEQALDWPIVSNPPRWFSDAETLLRALRLMVGDLEERIDSADRFVGPCSTALESGQRALTQADHCLRRAALTAAVAPPAQALPAPGGPVSAGVGAGGGNAPPPSSPPPPSTTPQTPAAASQASSSAGLAAAGTPAVDPSVFGGIKIQAGAQRILVGQSVKFVVTDMGNRMYTSVLWNSHNEELLSLGQDGTATGLKPGRLKIQAKTTEHPDAIAYLDIEVVEAASTSSDRPSDPATGPVKAASVREGTAAGGAVRSGDARPETARTSGAFGDRGLVTGPRNETQTGEQERGESISLLGQAMTPVAPPEQPGPSSRSAGFGDKGLETRSGTGQAAAPDLGGRQGAAAARVRPLEFQGGPQPAAWHIFATGSRLGWSAGYSRFTGGPADQEIIDHLIMAGEHAMWANRESYRPNRAWPNWSEIKVRFRTWAEQLERHSAPGKPREQLAMSISSYAASMAEQVTFQVIGDKKAAIPNCDGAYMRLGFHLAFGHTALQLAEGALRARQPQLSASARQGALDHLRQAARVLRDYERIAVVTGSCAELRDVRAEIEALLGRADLGAQVAMAGNAWTTASERIRALADLTARVRPETGPDTAKPETRPGTPTTPARTDPQPAASTGVLWADPGELEGTWVTTLARYRFERYGNDYVGKLERIFSPTTQSFEDAPTLHLAKQGHKEGDIVFRGTRTGPSAYRGTFQNRLAQRLSRTDPVRLLNQAIPVELLVLGDHLDIRSADISTDIGRTYEVWIRGMREAGVEKLPTDFGELSERQRSLFDQIGNAMIWLCASRSGPDGEIRSVVFQDLSQAVSRDFSRMGGVSIPLTSSDPTFKPFQAYVNSSVGLRRRLEEAGYAITFGPSSQLSCVNRIRAR